MQAASGGVDVDFFNEHGYLRLDARELLPQLGLLRAELSELISLRAQGIGAAHTPGVDHGFDDGLLALARMDRSHAGAVFDAASRLLSLHQLSIHPWLIEISKRIMGTDFVQCALDKALRMDFPGEERYLFPLHQDYTYDPSSPNGLVYWIPLRDVDEQSGCISYAGETHKAGIRDVLVRHKDTSEVTGNRLFDLADVSDVDRATMPLAELHYGEVLVFSNLLIHASGANRSENVRWTVQVRHGDFRHPTAVSKGWPHGNFRGKWFYQTHPERVREPEN
ncbi:MAG: phytanoyl-CoA dioxygenase family protein [Planctomycetota bacterium]